MVDLKSVYVIFNGQRIANGSYVEFFESKGAEIRYSTEAGLFITTHETKLGIVIWDILVRGEDCDLNTYQYNEYTQKLTHISGFKDDDDKII